MHILIINGPNLNLLGKREPEIYGRQSFEAYFDQLQSDFSMHQLSYFQSNDEGAIIDQLQAAAKGIDGILLNAAGYTHTSVAIADAVAAIPTPVIEVHISNPYSREDFRRKSFLSPYVKAQVAGFGLHSYRLALEGLLQLLKVSGSR
ncbi:MAG: type II 3-dehydroquinate dehydratase [Sphingobacteriaceae bacterium]|nr:type II 3-dehydroquinate dehydratase [Sphingobacteriaceae bacterium]